MSMVVLFWGLFPDTSRFLFPSHPIADPVLLLGFGLGTGPCSTVPSTASSTMQPDQVPQLEPSTLRRLQH